MKNFKCTLLESGLHIQGDAHDLNGGTYPVSLLLSTDEANLSWDKAKEWATERGGELPSRAQWQAIQAHRDEINKVLEAAGKETLGGWYWAGEEYTNDNSFAWCASMNDGVILYTDKNLASSVRAVSAFQL